MKKRLIDANALLQEIEDWHDRLGGTMNPADWGIQNVLQSVMDDIIEAEDVDAVAVVRCRECFKRGMPDLCPMCTRISSLDDMVAWDITEDDGFCHKGAKMDGGADDEGNA